MDYQVSLLRAIADQMRLAPVKTLALQPGVRAVFRLTVRYHDRRARDSIGTLRHLGRDEVKLEMIYRGLFEHKPLVIGIEPGRLEAFMLHLQQYRFDRLRDQPNLPAYGVDLWLLERAAGGFTWSVLLSPERAQGVYADLAQTVRSLLPEALRQVTA